MVPVAKVREEEASASRAFPRPTPSESAHAATTSARRVPGENDRTARAVWRLYSPSPAVTLTTHSVPSRSTSTFRESPRNSIERPEEACPA